jgi:hypothetical protein
MADLEKEAILGELRHAFVLLTDARDWLWELAEMVHRRDAGDSIHSDPFTQCGSALCTEVRELHLRTKELVP